MGCQQRIDNKIVKHFTQCSKSEKELIAKKLHNITKVSGISKHAKKDHTDRMKERTGETVENFVPYINTMLHNIDNIKEVTVKGKNRVRVLMKSKFTLKGKNGKEFFLCFVVSLDMGNLVTVIPVPVEDKNYKEASHKPYYKEFNVAEYIN